MDEMLEFLLKIDIQNLITIAGMFWLFKSHLDKKFDKIDQRFEKVEKEFKDEFKEVRKDIHDLRKEVQEIDKRLYRLEGAFSAKEFCMLKNSDYVKRVE